MLLPIVAIIALLIWGKGRLAFWEAGIMLVVPFLLIGVFKWSVETARVTDVEYWGGYVTKSMYEEDWNEYIHQTCSRECCCSTDSKGNRSCGTEYYDCSYVEYHPETWWVADNLGTTYSISPQDFNRLTIQFGNKSFVDMNRNYYTNDGDAYLTTFDNDYAKIEPTAASHYYENRVAVSSSIFNFKDIPYKEAQKKQLYEYPEIYGYRLTSILGNAGPQQAQAEKMFQDMNGLLGTTKQAHVFVLLWKNKDMTIAQDQQQYWKNGNKNELVINIGTDDAGNVKWAYVFSWTPAEAVKVETRSFIMEQKTLDLIALANWLKPEIENKWERKHFREFSYLTVEPPTWAIVVTFILTLLVTVGIGFWSIVNSFNNTVLVDKGFNQYDNGLDWRTPLANLPPVVALQGALRRFAAWRQSRENSKFNSRRNGF